MPPHPSKLPHHTLKTVYTADASIYISTAYQAVYFCNSEGSVSRVYLTRGPEVVERGALAVTVSALFLFMLDGDG
jgi:hypothetical protein